MHDRPLHLLIIEDNPDHAELFLANLSLTAYADARTVQHDTFQAGLECLRAKQFDLLFIDLSLKDSSIRQTLDRLPELSGCPVIVLTSLDDRKTLLDIIGRGADDCVPKTELNDVLLERIIHFNLDRWRLKQELVESREAYRELYHNSPNMLGSVDAETSRLLTCNQTFAEKLYYSTEEIIGREITAFYHPDCLDKFNRIFALFLQTGAVKNAEMQLRRKDGSKVDVLLNASAIRHESGKILHSQSTWIDITEKKSAERELQYMQCLNRLIIETIPDLLWLKDINGVYLTCNPRFEKFFGAPEEDIVGRTDYDFMAKELADFSRKNDRKAVRLGEAVVNEEWITLAADGSKLLLETTKTPLLYDDGSVAGVMGIGHDITERYEAAEKVEAASRAKSAFLSNMSHELRTPLNAILGYTQIFSEDKTLSAGQRNGIRTIHQAGEHLLLLINDILDLSKIESGRLELVDTELFFAPFLQGIQDIIRLRVKKKGLDFHYETEGWLPSVIIADELRLRQILLNLLSNAVKFTKNGYCILRIRAEPSDDKKVMLTMMIEDSGPGITEKEQQLVFEPFLQAGERLQHREGTGLGLAISRRLVRLMGGKLRLVSPVNRNPPLDNGVGSCFFFSIKVPALLENRNTPGDTDGRSRGLGYSCPGGSETPCKVLIVDDKTSSRTVLRDILEPLGFLVQEVKDGGEVIATCEHFRPNIILMDLHMPNMDGPTAAEAVRQYPDLSHIPLIAITSSEAEDREMHQRCLEYGFNDYIHKPFSSVKLLKIMTDQLHIELSYADSIIPKNQEDIIAPPQKILNELAYLVETGEIQAINEKAAELLLMDSGRYQEFSRRVQELADEFQFTALQNFIANQQKGNT